MCSFVCKYAPKKVEDIVGQKLAISKIIEFLNTFSKKKKNALLIYGPPGIGKTSAIYAIANEYNYEIVEMNSDEIRDKEKINYKLGNTINTGSLFGKKKFVLIDELESIDAGSLTRIIELIKKSKIPVLLIAIDMWEQKFKFLRSYCEKIEFKKLSKRDISKELIRILNSEGIKFEQEVIESIVKNAEGDLRAAINDLETVCAGKKEIKKEDVTLEQRDLRKNVFEALQKIFKSDFSPELLDVFRVSNIDLNTGIMWLSENICSEYRIPKEIAQAFDYLSRSDVFLARIRKRQYWRFYTYANILSTAGINISKEKTNLRFTRYAFPSKLLKLSKSKDMRKLMKSISSKIAPKLHVSSDIFLKEYIPMLKIMLKTNSNLKKEFVEFANLTNGELNVLVE